MKIELETKYLTSEQQKQVFNMAVDAKVREQLSEKAGSVGQRRRNTKRNSAKRFTETEIMTIWKEYKNGNSIKRISSLIDRPMKSVKMVIYRMRKNYKLSLMMKKVLSS